MKTTLTAIATVASSLSFGSSLIWSNIVNNPGDLTSTGDGWSATRAEDVASYRIAADDVVFPTRVRINRVNYYSVQVGIPVILGADYYLYADGGGVPGSLIGGEHDLPINHYDTGLFNTAFQSNVYGNEFQPTAFDAGPGQYFFAFRTVESRIGGQKNGALTTRVALGSYRAMWNFDVSVGGTANQGWVGMNVFNGVQNQEWAFELHGQQVVAPQTVTVVLGRHASGNLSSLGRQDNDSFRVCKFLVPNQQISPIQVEVSGAAFVGTCTGLTFSVKSRMVDGGQFSQSLDLWDWTINDWDTTDTRTDSLGTSFAVNNLLATGNVSRLLRNSDHALRARYRIRQTGPSAALLWCHEVDEAVWLVTP